MKGDAITGLMLSVLFLVTSACSKEAEVMELRRLPEPKVRVCDVGNTSFRVSWDAVTDAGAYTYVFNDGVEVVTKERNVSFSDLEPDTEYVFSVRTDAGVNGNCLASEYVTLHVITDGRGVLETPEPELVAAYKSRTIITWKAVRGATSYEYNVGKYSGTVTACSVDLSGLEGSTEYIFSLKAVSGDKYTDSSPYGELRFTTEPDDNDIPQIIMSLRESGADYTSFNIYAVPDFRYLYFAIPASYFVDHTDEEVQNIYLNYVLDAIDKAGYTLEAGIAYYSSFGSATYTEYPLYPEMSYYVVAFGIDARGKVTTPLYKELTRTLANDTSPIPDVPGPEWFRQRLYLGTFGGYNPSNCLWANWSGMNVTEMKYILTSTASFRNFFGGDVENFKDYVMSEGLSLDGENLATINGEGGLTTRVSLNPATSYTIGSLVTNAGGEISFAMNSMATKASPNYYDWLFLELGPDGDGPSFSLAANVTVAFDPAEQLNIQIAEGKYCFCKADELEGLLVSDLSGILAEKGTDFSGQQVRMMNMTGKLSMSFGADDITLEPDTRYALLVSLVSVGGDEIVRYAFATTAKAGKVKSAGRYGLSGPRFETRSSRILDIYEFSR